MITAVKGVLILTTAVGAHFKRSHGGVFAVIGNIVYNRESWSTVGTIQKRIEETTVIGIMELAQTVRAGRQVWLYLY